MNQPNDFVPRHVQNDLEWGRLVMSWSTQQDYRNGADGSAPYPYPPLVGNPPHKPTSCTVPGYRMSRQDFDGAVKSATNGTTSVNLPSDVAWVILVQDPRDTRILRLPEGQMVEQARQAIINGSQYILPDFYNDPPFNFDGSTLGVNDALVLQADRIGDYVIASCM